MTLASTILRLSRRIGNRIDAPLQLSRAKSKDSFQSQFGSRNIKDEDQIYEHNAWDDVGWDEEREKKAKEKVAVNESTFVSAGQREELERQAAERWNDFYANHKTSGFYRNRNWLLRVFPELGNALETPRFDDDSDENSQISSMADPYQTRPINVFEVGCGPGSAVFPLMQLRGNNINLFLYCCDFSEVAIELLKGNDSFDEDRCVVFHWDITDTERKLPVADGSMDFVTVFFVLSTIDPSHHRRVIQRLSRLLRPGGRILFRDYGRYDMTQLRLKTGSAITRNFYARGNGTRVYFFTVDEIRDAFIPSGLKEEFIHCDNKLAINRKLQLKMYRVWILAQFVKLD